MMCFCEYNKILNTKITITTNMNSSEKYGEDDFSTNQVFHESRRYSSRQKILKRRTNASDTYPYRIEKAVITIQKFWRLRAALRRVFYEQLYSELYSNNQVALFKNRIEKQHVQKLQEYNNFYEKYNQIRIKQKFLSSEETIKKMAKKCVGTTFKLQKKMLTTEELSKVSNERKKIAKKITELNNQKHELRGLLSEQYQDEEKVLLREIRQANSTLLRLTTRKNELKQKMQQSMILLESKKERINM